MMTHVCGEKDSGAARESDALRTEDDYRAALQEVDSLWTAVAGTPEGERLEMLARLVEAYEEAHERSS